VINHVHIEQIACLRSTDLSLTKLHALIGPNDSGKSLILRTIVQAIRAGLGQGHNLLGGPGSRIRLDTARGSYSIEHDQQQWIGRFPAGTHSLDGGWLQRDPEIVAEIVNAVIVDFDPPQLRNRSKLLPDAEHINFLENRGAGLPGIYDAILNTGDRSFYEISDALAGLFPAVKRLRLNAVSSVEKEIEIELVSGQRIPAAQVSEGILYFLAYAALQHVHPSPVLLIEEPETGLHPARIREVMRVLRGITEAPNGPQIVMATHSPLVINEMQPDEVSVVTRSVEEGTKVRCIKEAVWFAERREVMSLGELWLNYCDGVEEEPLFEGAEP
jgi:predicted ATPase